MGRKEILEEIFQNIDNNQRKLIEPLIEEIDFLERKMAELKKLPFLNVHPKNPALQKKTEASKAYKECCQSYMNAIRILISLLPKANGEAESPLRQYLKEIKIKYEQH